MKKISIGLLIIIIINFIFSNFVLATSTDGMTYSKDSYHKLVNEGEIEINGTKRSLEITQSTLGSICGILFSCVNPFALTVSTLMSKISNDGGFYYTESEFGASENGWFTIASLVFGEYLLFNARPYQRAVDLNPDIESTKIVELQDNIKSRTIAFFELLRYVAIAAFLVLLIITGIFLALADVAEDIARYKEVLKTWFIALLFIFIIPFFIIIIDHIEDILMNILWKIRIALENNGYSSFEIEIMNNLFKSMDSYGGIKVLAYGIEYSAFVFLQAKFFIKYGIRLINILLLIALYPVCAIMHTFNKIKGESSKILENWIVKYFMNVIMQPSHAFLYLLFIFTASQIAVNAPLLAILFIWALLWSERVFKAMFNINTGKVLSIFKG